MKKQLNKNKISLRLYFAIAFACCFLSCKKIVDIEDPKNLLLASSVFESDGSAAEAVNGIYASIDPNATYLLENGVVSIYLGLDGDELQYNGTSANFQQFGASSILSSNSYVNFIWTYTYPRLYSINACLEGLTNSTQLSPAVKTELIGECKFLRAFEYYYLSQIYGDVPLVLTTDYRVNAQISRTANTDVRTQVVADLMSAESLLSDTYINGIRTKPNKFAAIALLARIYLEQGKWDLAEIESTKIIGSSQFALQSDLTKVFAPNGLEAIWQLSPPGTTRLSAAVTSEGSLYNPATTSSIPSYSLRAGFLGSFELGDKRKTNWIKTNTIGINSYSYPNKYKQRPGVGIVPTEYNTIFRLAEQILIRSEARLKQTKLADAVADLNLIRARARDNTVPGALPNLSTGLTESQVASAISQERRIELFCEWGHRWFDLKRRNELNVVVSPLKPAWKTTSVLFPIPIAEINLNPNLTQNPGYN